MNRMLPMSSLKTVLAGLLSLSIAACIAAGTEHSHDSNAIASNEASGSSFQDLGTRPAPPSNIPDTTYSQPTGRTIPVSGSDDSAARAFQSALESAHPGDVISLDSRSAITGNFVLPVKQGAGWVIIRTAVPDGKFPSAGTRVGPADSAVMPKLISPNADPVIRTAPGAHHYRFIGIEFTTAPGWETNYGLISLGDTAQKSLEVAPHDLIIDRCYIHGNGSVNLRRGVALNSASTAIIDSHISEIHEAGADSQAICGWNGPGPFKIANNYLEASGENVMFGGADAAIRDLVPSDIEFRGNHCSKPLSWIPGRAGYAGKHWSVKNLMELKNARRVLIEGNLFENNWLDGQSGFAVLFTVRNQDGGSPWSVVEDVSFINNIVRHSAAGIQFIGRDNNHPSQQLKRVIVANNLFEDVGGKDWGGNGRWIQITETAAVTIDHNTVFQTGNLITAHGAPNQGFEFTNNIALNNEYGIIGDGTSPGTATLNKYFPGGLFRKNAIIGGRSSIYPGDNFFPAGIEEAKFADRARGDYTLGDGSPYRHAGSDRKNLGCDMNALKAIADRSQAGRSSNESR